MSEVSTPASHQLHSAFNHALSREWQEDASRIARANLMFPIFVTDDDTTRAISSLVGMHHVPAAQIVDYIAPHVALGLKSVIVFGVVVKNTSTKDGSGTCALSDSSPCAVAVRALKAAYGAKLLVATDVCLCGYTSHGHCGVFCADGKRIDQAASAEQIAQIALHYARAGADIVAPSDMMDGRIATIKSKLIANGFGNTVSVMAYSAKFASSMYGPFRQAALSAPAFGDRRCYQLPPGGRGLALRAVKRDIAEGADFVMVKPAGAYLDIIREVADLSDLPVAAYQVSGEYAMIHAAAAAGSLDLEAAAIESVTAIRRAGATIILTYFTPMLLKIIADREGRLV